MKRLSLSPFPVPMNFILVSSHSSCFNENMKVKPNLNLADIKLFKTIFYPKAEIDKKFQGLKKYADSKFEETRRYTDIKIDLSKDEIIEQQQKSATDIKSYFFDLIDPFLKEIKASQEEREIIAHRLKQHTDEIEKLKKHLHN